jgi:predicted enzyme related to lactoylglutathione lyase
MPARPSSDSKQFVQGVPVLHVPDVPATAAFYRDVLGFTWDFGDETYAVVWRDLRDLLCEEIQGPRGVHLFHWVNDVDGYYREVVDRGAKFTTEPTDQPYGIREFGLCDINSVGLVFGQDVEQE